MSPVKVVFANGSKQMANNTNDLYERWQLRSSEFEHFTNEQLVAEVIKPDFVPQLNFDFRDMAEAQKIKVMLIEQRVILDKQIRVINEVLKSNMPRLVYEQWVEKREAIKQNLALIATNLRGVKLWIQDCTVANQQTEQRQHIANLNRKIDELSEALKAEHQKVVDLSEQVIKLQGQLITALTRSA